MSTPGSSGSTKRTVAAVFLGTALSALGANSLDAAEINPRAVNDIGRYCTSCWRNARLPMDAWGDCTQEVFRRLLERIPTTSWDKTLRIDADERREFIRAIDAVKKRVQRARRYADGVEVAADPRPGNDRRLAEQREEVSRAADEVLSARQKRIMQLSFEGWSVQEIADEVVMPVERVSDEKYKAIRKLRSHLTRVEG